MTTLGALSVGLLVLVLVVAAGIALLARSQRRAPRGPEQPRTVADLVRLRETEAEARAAADDATTGPGVSTDVAPAAEPAAETPSAEADVVGSPPAGESPEGDAKAQEPAAAAAKSDLGPAPTGLASVSLQETPWARAAHMADPLGEWTASARAAREREGSSGPHPAPGGLPQTPAPDKDPAGPTPPRMSLLDPGRPARAHDTTTIAHLPKGFAQAAVPVDAASEVPASGEAADIAHPAAAASADPPAAAVPEEVTAPVVDNDETVQIGPSPGPWARRLPPARPDGGDGVDDSVTVDFTRPQAGRPAEPACAPPAAQPPDGPTPPVDPKSCTTFGPPLGPSITVAAVGVALAPLPTPARVAGRVRRNPADTAAEQAAADLALLRTFGVAGPGRTAAADDTEIELEGCSPDDAEPSAGRAQPVAFRVVGRDGRGLAGASVTLLDDHGREISGTTADENGAGSLTARRPGGYMLVTAAEGYQPGAVTIAVADAPVDTEIPLTRSASIAGSVCGEDGPVVGAHLVLVQDGEIVDTADSGVDGAYVFADLAAGEYGLSVTASECEPAALVLRLADEVDLRHDVDLDPVGLPAGGVSTGDVMIGHL